MSKPIRLAKEDNSNQDSLEFIGDWALDHAHILLPLALITLLILIGCVIGVVVSGGNITTSEGNNYYYHLNDAIKTIRWRI